MDLLLILILAFLFGALAGLTPGINPLVGMMIAVPLVSQFSVEYIIIFWVCYSCVVQYYGSVSALLFRIPGEVSSIPVLVASQNLKLAKTVIFGYRLTAFTSFVASVISLIILYALYQWLQPYWYYLFTTKFIVAGLVGLFTLLLIARQQYLLNFILICSGLFISNFSHSDAAQSICDTHGWACFALHPVDVLLSITCLYAAPSLFSKDICMMPRNLAATKLHSWWMVVKFKWVAVWYGIVGFVIGFSPGVGTTLASNFSATLVSAKNKKRSMTIMAASEASNNSAAISSAVPFLFLGLPITPTEIFLDNWLSIHRATSITSQLFTTPMSFLGLDTTFSIILFSSILVVNILAFVASSGFIQTYQNLSKLPMPQINFCIKALVLISIGLIIWESNTPLTLSVINAIIFSVVGIYFSKRKLDPIALPISLVIGKFAIGKFVTAYYLWS